MCFFEKKSPNDPTCSSLFKWCAPWKSSFRLNERPQFSFSNATSVTGCLWRKRVTLYVLRIWRLPHTATWLTGHMGVSNMAVTILFEVVNHGKSSINGPFLHPFSKIFRYVKWHEMTWPLWFWKCVRWRPQKQGLKVETPGVFRVAMGGWSGIIARWDDHSPPWTMAHLKVPTSYPAW